MAMWRPATPLPEMYFSGPDILRPLSIGYMKWRLLAPTTFHFDEEHTRHLCFSGVKLKMGPNWYADLDVCVPGDPLCRVKPFRIFHWDSDREIAFGIDSLRAVQDEGAVYSLVPTYSSLDPPRCSRRVTIHRGEPLAILTLRRCSVPGCDHSDCG